MRWPILGRVECTDGYGCSRCNGHDEANILTNLVHDLRCWGVRTAFFNAWVRLSVPDWFIYDNSQEEAR